MMICDKEALVGYIYDELGDTERAAFEDHLAACHACREEVAGLRATRAHLAKWAPPEPDFGFPRFRVVRDDGAPAAARRFRVSPAWGLAAAAVLLLAVASAIANLEIRYGSEGLVVRTGWARTPPAAPAPVSPEITPVSASDTSKVDLLEKLEQRVRTLEAAPSSRLAASSQVVSRPGQISDQELLRQVRTIINQSEARQQRELALRVAQVVREFDAQRQTDLVRVQQGLQQMQGMTDAELIRHRDTLNYLVRVAQSR
jgi:hypothetical protein